MGLGTKNKHWLSIRWLLHSLREQYKLQKFLPGQTSSFYIQQQIVNRRMLNIPSTLLKGVYTIQKILNENLKRKLVYIKEERNKWYNSWKSYSSKNYYCFKLNPILFKEWRKYKQQNQPSKEQPHSSYYKYMNLFYNPNITDLFDRIILKEHYVPIQWNIHTIEDLGIIEPSKLGIFKWIPSPELLQAGNQMINKFIHLIKLVIVNMPQIINPQPEYLMDIPGKTCYMDTPRKYIDFNEINSTILKNNTHNPMLITEKNLNFIIKPHADIYRIIVGFYNIKYTGKNKVRINTLENEINRLDIYEDNSQVKEKVTLFWKEKQRNQTLSNELGRLDKLNKENRWNELFNYRFRTNTLLWWHKDRKIDNQCKFCKNKEETLEHVFFSCPTIKYSWVNWASILGMNLNDDTTILWKYPRLSKPLLIHGNSLTVTSSLFITKEIINKGTNLNNNNNNKFIKENNNNIKWKLDYQKRLWQMGQKVILQEIWASRNKILHEEVNKITKEHLWRKIKSQIYKYT